MDYTELKDIIKAELINTRNVDTTGFPNTTNYKEGVIDTLEIVLAKIEKLEQNSIR